MAVTFLEPGGDATFNVANTTVGGFWGITGGIGPPTAATDFVHGSHKRSLQFHPATQDRVISPAGTSAETGGRASFYVYFVAFATTAGNHFFGTNNSGEWRVAVTSAGVLRMYNGTPTQMGSDGPTLNTGQWYRISIGWTVTDATNNRFEVFVDGVSAISVTNATLLTTGANNLKWGNLVVDSTLDSRVSDIYMDDSSSLTDPGNIWVTAKRPNANGTANNFVTQIGAGGSGYGTGHSPQVNERPLSNTNGWSIVAVGATTEEYNIEGKSTGDIDISNSTTWDLLKEDGSNLLQENQSFILLQNENQNKVVDYIGWIDYNTILSETPSIVVNGVSTPFTSTTNAETMFTKVTGFGGYPAGTGTDIGMISDATATTVSLYEAGIIVAYIPATITPVSVVSPIQQFQLLGVGT